VIFDSYCKWWLTERVDCMSHNWLIQLLSSLASLHSNSTRSIAKWLRWWVRKSLMQSTSSVRRDDNLFELYGLDDESPIKIKLIYFLLLNFTITMETCNWTKFMDFIVKPFLENLLSRFFGFLA
jgi:hypothetical protein